MRAAQYSIKELAEMIKERQGKEYDMTFCVSGARGNGKSTLIWKLFRKIGGFHPKIQICYSRKEVMHLLDTQQFGLIFDDEAIQSGYRRNFFEEDQKKLIKMLTMYRDNFNIYAMAIPRFYRLDKDLRDLLKVHIHIIRRGWGVIYVSRDDILHGDDPWESKYNAKIEQSWLKRLKKKPNWRVPYHKLTTFIGYIKFEPMIKSDEIYYKQLKRDKRTKIREEENLPAFIRWKSDGAGNGAVFVGGGNPGGGPQTERQNRGRTPVESPAWTPSCSRSSMA